ncbi:MAG: HNH endonuclease [Jatrophihabitantaceae bacterium]
MTTYLLTWNPDRWGWPEADFVLAVDTTASGRNFRGQWSTGNRVHGIAKGDRAFLLRQHRDRGVVASGRFTSAVFQDAHWDGSERSANYARVSFDTVLPVEDRLTTGQLKRQIPGVGWDRLQGSGIRVADTSVALLEALWARHSDDMPYRSPEELPVGEYEEGAVTRVEVNRYERDRAARRACIAHHGTACVACGFDFGKRYGRIGRGFINVHHIREISTLGPGYKVDPKNDLVPLCANCHAMVHRTRPALLPAQLRRRLHSV